LMRPGSSRGVRWPDASAVAHFVALAAGSQSEMGNSRPGCRMEKVLSQARIASIGSARQARGRTVTPEVAVSGRVAHVMIRAYY
jgi:hypothetical protein